MAFYTKVSCIVRTLVLRNFIFFLFQVWLLIGPKFSRKFIQRADVLHTVCFPACLLEICAKCMEGQCRNFFLVYSTRMNFFFHLIFPCMNFFFVLRPPTITLLMVRPLRGVAQGRANNTTARKINICISARRKTWKWDKTEKLFSKR